MKTLKLGKETRTVDLKPLQRERDEVRALLGTRYAPNHHHIMIDSVHRHGNVQVVLYIVETAAYYHRRVAVIKEGRIENDIIAEQQ